ncbi:lymphocyte antigen 96 isoform X1 [Antechinus flavipes]|uniref:lymphocyte antigen 96 isoform X1 n=1 Tax=Antechinus flavipes TaxID=38775 RepID=UPI002235A444|nr:lymphocyte antigen 96 isoform X1 [Antechinus flavipes]
MLLIVFFSTLFTFTFIESVKNKWTCRTQDTEISYSSCDDKKPIPTINVRPCLSWKQTKGNLSLYYVPRRDLKDLYFNIHAEFKSSIILPHRKEIICRGADGDYSFCNILKGDKDTKANRVKWLAHSHKAETLNATVYFSFSLLKFLKGFYIFIAEAFSAGMQDSLFCCNITLKIK